MTKRHNDVDIIVGKMTLYVLVLIE